MLEWLAKKYKDSPVAQLLVNCIPYVGSGVNQYLISRAERSFLFESFSNIRQLLDFTEKIDSKIRPLIRDHNIAKDEEVIEEYASLYKHEFREHKLDLGDFLRTLRHYDFLNKAGIREIPRDLLVDIEGNFRKITFRYDEVKLEIENPELLWDCHCLAPEGSFWEGDRPENASDIPCRIHSNRLGAKVAARFNGGLVEIRYDKIKVAWKNSKEFWPPSIDTIHMYENLKSDGVMNKRFQSVLDIGSGTGFLGISIAKLNPHVERLYLSDWLLTPLVCSKINWEINRGDDLHVKCVPMLGMGKTWLNESHTLGPFDICICNPPYLPTLKDFPQIRTSSTVGGTDLLKLIIKEGKGIAKEIYVSFSNIAAQEAFSAAQKVNANLKQIGKACRVPFRVTHALKEKNYVNELSQKRGLEISEKGRYKYWHTISTYKIAY